MHLIFISHSSADRPVAESLAKHIEVCGPEIKTFVASRPGDIRADADWLPSVQNAIREADAYVILLTTNSVLRPWVSFETGAAWFSSRPCILVRAGGLQPKEIPLPLSSKQVYSLDAVDDVRAVFGALGLESPNVNVKQVVADIESIIREVGLVGEAEPAWEGVEFQGTFYAWADPMLGLDDKEEIQCPPQLPEIIKQRGLAVRFGNRDRLSHHYGKGRSQVFATDRRNWRRPVVSGDQLLLVARPEDLTS